MDSQNGLPKHPRPETRNRNGYALAQQGIEKTRSENRRQNGKKGQAMTDEPLSIILLMGIFLAGYGIVCLLGLMVVKVWDRKKRKFRWWVVGSCL